MIAAVTYSTDNYESLRKLNVKTAYSKGKANIVFEFTPNDIDIEFRERFKHILNNPKGAGLWLWKPYIINKALRRINDNDFLIYSDAASYYVNKIQYLVDSLILSKQDIMTFELPLISRQWTKHETFVQMKCDKYGFEDENQILASFILIRKCRFSVSFIEEYLDNCCDLVSISPNQFNINILNSIDFLSHREDQSILSILCMKYKLKPFRDPSQYGERPWEYFLSKEVIFRPKEYTNSDYPTIFYLTRKKVSHTFFTIKNLIKKVLSLFPFYIKWEINRRSRISYKYSA